MSAYTPPSTPPTSRRSSGSCHSSKTDTSTKATPINTTTTQPTKTNTQTQSQASSPNKPQTQTQAPLLPNSSNSGSLQRTLDAVVVGLSCAGAATYIYSQRTRFSLSPLELASLSATSLAVGYSLFSLGKSSNSTDTREEEPSEEEARSEREKELQLACGKAYIAKEKAFRKYEKHGGYGGADWREFVARDGECKAAAGEWEGFVRGE